LKADGNEKGVVAIGILGSDVHDKLMILEALSQYFPHKLFFTTDLDAAYNHPAKRRQTHNLLVASAFDLKLRPELQGTILPFRDSYQTAFFLATQLVLKGNNDIKDLIYRNEFENASIKQSFINNILDAAYDDQIHVDISEPEYFIKEQMFLETFTNKIKTSPLLFEIGRNHPILLPTNEDIPQSDNDRNNKAKCSWTNWSEWHNKMQPHIFAKSQLNWTMKDVLVIVDVIVVVLLFFFVSPWFRKKVIEALNYCNSNRKDMVVVILVSLLVYFLIVYCLKLYFTQIEAEPFYWLEGVSIWPSQLLRLSIFPFVYFFVRWGNKRIKKCKRS
jgi:hypothetical protein